MAQKSMHQVLTKNGAFEHSGSDHMGRIKYVGKGANYMMVLIGSDLSWTAVHFITREKLGEGKGEDELERFIDTYCL